MSHFTSKSFWDNFAKLPQNIKLLADRNFELLKTNSNHPSLHFKLIGNHLSFGDFGYDTRVVR